MGKAGYPGLVRSDKLKRYVRKGVPGPHRAGVWLAVSGAGARLASQPEVYPALLARPAPAVMDQITTDLPRTFPDNIYFDPTHPDSLRPALNNVLRAFAVSNPGIGYCQGLNYVAGLLLLVTRREESAYWLLVVLCENILPAYYAPGMPGLLTDVRVLARLCHTHLPRLARHIDTLQLPWELLCSKWFICLYCEVLPVETVLRLWDAVFYEGDKILLRAGLGLLKVHNDRLVAQPDLASMMAELKLVERGGQVLGCHAFLQEITVRGPALPRAKLSRLRLECGEQVQAEQREREERRQGDGSSIIHG